MLFRSVANTASTSTTYNMTGLTNGTAYTFRVSAVNAAGAGTASSNVVATPFIAAAAPTGLAATASAGQVALSWTAPSNNGGTAITSYKLDISSDGGATWADLVADTGSTTTTYTATSLTNGQAYSFRVSGINAAGIGAASSVVSATPFSAPSAPASVSVTAGDAQVLVVWTAPTSSNGASVTGYVIDRYDGSSWTTLVSNTGNALTRYTATGLTNGTAYSFRVSAINSAGTGSATTSGNATPVGAPSAPGTLAIKIGRAHV